MTVMKWNRRGGGTSITAVGRGRELTGLNYGVAANVAQRERLGLPPIKRKGPRSRKQKSISVAAMPWEGRP